MDQDTSGFVFRDSADEALDLVYRHREGVQYPVTCRLLPRTHLQWKDYEFRGTIIKPEGAAYDSIGVGAVVYRESPERYYALEVSGFGSTNNDNVFRLVSHQEGAGNSVLATLTDLSFCGDTDEVKSAVQIMPVPPGVPEGDTVIDMKAKVWMGEAEPTWGDFTTLQEANQSRLKRSGYAGIKVDMTAMEDPGASTSHGVRLDDLRIEKLYRIE